MRKALLGAMALLMSACASMPQEETVEIGYIAAFENFDMNARIGSIQPSRYIVWMWEQREHLRRENLLAEGENFRIRLWGGLTNNTLLWQQSSQTAVLRTRIPVALALRSGLLCVEVKGRPIVHAAYTRVRHDPDGTWYITCSYRLNETIVNRRAFIDGFGIPIFLERNRS